MQINNLDSFHKSTPSELNSSTIKQGDILTVSVKERINRNEAKVTIKGSEQKVTFEGAMPKQDRVQVEVVQSGKDGIVLKQVSSQTSSLPTQNSTADQMTRAGYNPLTNRDLSQAVNLLTSKGIPISKESITVLDQFLKNETGSFNEKLDVIRALADKGLEVTSAHLKSIHQALNGQALAHTLKDIAKHLNTSVSNQNKNSITISDLRQLIQKGSSFERSAELIKNYLTQQNSLSKDQINILSRALQEAGQLANTGQASLAKAKLVQSLLLLEKAHNLVQSQTIQEPKLQPQASNNNAMQTMLKEIQREPSMDKVFGKVQDFLQSDKAKSLANIDSLIESLQKAEALQSKGRELSARKEILSGFTLIIQDNPQLQKNATAEVTLTDEEQSYINQTVNQLKLESKTILVTEISQRLSQLAIDFKKVRQDLTRNLDLVSKTLDTAKVSPTPIKQVLESTIKQLDQAILKGDFMLYTDMATEKKLLSASSRLSEARNLLVNGQHLEASKIVKDIKTQLQEIVFKPADVKVKHFVAEQSLQRTENQPLEQTLQSLKMGDTSGRNVLELIKKLGMMNENDIAHSFVASEKAKPEQQANLKATLMKMLQSDDLNPRVAQQVEQAANNITGQQLLNKQDPTGMQNLAFQLPFLLKKEMENVKVYINSQKNGDQIDWENCSLYFVMETKKLGEIGILLNATNRNISITFKNDKNDLKEKMVPLTDGAKERLQEIGYQLGSMSFKPFSQERTEKQEQTTRVNPTMTAKGYDFSI